MEKRADGLFDALQVKTIMDHLALIFNEHMKGQVSYCIHLFLCLGKTCIRCLMLLKLFAACLRVLDEPWSPFRSSRFHRKLRLTPDGCAVACE